VIRLDPLGLDRVYLQAKCYRPDAAIDAGMVRDFSGSLDARKTSRGVFITTSRFTKAARDYVDSIAKPIALIDGAALARLMAEHKVGSPSLPDRSRHAADLRSAFGAKRA